MEIKETRKEDLLMLFDLIRKTFADTYTQHNTKKNIVDYLTINLSNEQLLKEYNNSDSHFYTLTDEAKIIGYLKLNTNNAQSETKDLKALEIERIYVSSTTQKKGYGKALMDFCKSKAKELKSSYLWLGVWENNENAIGFYKHMGFEIFDTHSFWLGDDKQQDYLMKWIY